MNWYKGNIAEAVAHSKVKNAIFVVFVEGLDDTTKKLSAFLNETRIRDKLESDQFVAIKIESSSQAYMQFASIYQAVPVPSIFFIGKSGTPLDIGTGIIASVEELEAKIEKVLSISRTPSVSANTSFIAAEQESVSSSSHAVSNKEEEVVCDGEVCYKKPKSTEQVVKTSVEENKTPSAATESDEAANDRLEETRKLLEQKRRQRIEEEKRQEKESELRRRQDSRNVQNLQNWQKEQELKELKDNIRKERLEEQAARDRIRAQIAADRAERANRNAAREVPTHAEAPAAPQAPQVSNADTARIQFRFSSGENKMHMFESKQTLAEVQSYVRSELIPGTGIREFSLSTTYPKRIFTGEDDSKTLNSLSLCPTAVILIIGKESSTSPSALLARSGGLINMFTTLFWAILSPVFAIGGYLKNKVTGAGGAGGAATGAQKRANEEESVKHDAAKRRNLDRFGTREASTSNEPTNADSADSKPYRRYGSNVHRLNDNRKDSDDENATWNGNSTQQQ